MRLLLREISATTALTSAKAFTEWNSAFFLQTDSGVDMIHQMEKKNICFFLWDWRLWPKLQRLQKRPMVKITLRLLWLPSCMFVVGFHWLRWFLTCFLYFQRLCKSAQTPKCFSIYNDFFRLEKFSASPRHFHCAPVWGRRSRGEEPISRYYCRCSTSFVLMGGVWRSNQNTQTITETMMVSSS